MKYTKVSIIIPVYNEEKTIQKTIEEVLASDTLGMEKEIIVVDDGSSDNTKNILSSVRECKIIRHKKNLGKGAAVKTGFQNATGDIIIIQDADLEYSPSEYKKLIAALMDDSCDVVYGSRMLGNNPVGYWYMYFGNYVISLATRILYGTKITDVETCYKIFLKKVVDQLDIQSSGFEVEPEITAKILKKGFHIKEIPIRYSPRKYNEGKKIKWHDGIKALWILAYYRFFSK